VVFPAAVASATVVVPPARDGRRRRRPAPDAPRRSTPVFPTAGPAPRGTSRSPASLGGHATDRCAIPIG